VGTVNPGGARAWRQAAARALGAISVAAAVAVAIAALLLPPPAEADAIGPAAPQVAGPLDALDSPDAARSWLAAAASAALSSGFERPAPAARRPPARCGGGPSFTGKVNLNQAGERELDLLPGVGPAKARRIVAWRESHGPFRRLRDLRRVKGFGRKTVLKLTPYLTLDGPTTATAAESKR
jgi:competence protein ComEA